MDEDWEVAAEAFEPVDAPAEVPTGYPASTLGMALLRWSPFTTVFAALIYENRADIGVLLSNVLACGLLYALYQLARGRLR